MSLVIKVKILRFFPIYLRICGPNLTHFIPVQVIESKDSFFQHLVFSPNFVLGFLPLLFLKTGNQLGDLLVCYLSQVSL